MRLVLAAALALLAVQAQAAPPAKDPMKSGACARDLSALQAAREPGSDTTPDQREALRRAATRSCLGGDGEAHRPSPTAQAPLAVPAPMVALPRSTPPSLPAVPAPALPERPAVITSCDHAGCWDSNGTRLNRTGPLLIGPTGACVRTGLQVHCP